MSWIIRADAKDMSQGDLMALLQREFPGVNIRPTEEWDGSKGGLWTGFAEQPVDGELMFDYWAGAEGREPLHPRLKAILDSAGWLAEPHDAGTLMLWPRWPIG